jgi:hypothetical protein
LWGRRELPPFFFPPPYSPLLSSPSPSPSPLFFFGFSELLWLSFCLCCATFVCPSLCCAALRLPVISWALNLIFFLDLVSSTSFAQPRASSQCSPSPSLLVHHTSASVLCLPCPCCCSYLPNNLWGEAFYLGLWVHDD